MNQFTTRLTTIDLPNMLAKMTRNAIGYDRVFDDIDRFTTNIHNADKFPPHDIIKFSETSYSIVLAVAGFKRSEIEILAEGNTLEIIGNQTNRKYDNMEFMYKGISAKTFNRMFSLADHAVVSGATFEDGLLTINISIEVPDAMKRKKIEIAESKLIS